MWRGTGWSYLQELAPVWGTCENIWIGPEICLAKLCRLWKMCRLTLLKTNNSILLCSPRRKHSWEMADRLLKYDHIPQPIQGGQHIKKWSVSSPTKTQLSPPSCFKSSLSFTPLECWVYLCSAARHAINLFTRAREESGNILLPLSYTHLQCCSFSMLSPSLRRPLSSKMSIHSQQSECQQFIYICFPPPTSLFFSLDLQL